MARAPEASPAGAVPWPKWGANGGNPDGTYLVFDGEGHQPATIAPLSGAVQPANGMEACAFWEEFLVEKITTQCVPPGDTWKPAC